MDGIYSRRSRKEFTDKPIEFEKIAEILNAGHHAPSAGNLQNWRFIVVTDKTKLKNFPDYCQGQEYTNCPLAIVVCSDDTDSKKHFESKSSSYNSQNCAAAMQNMLLAANNYAIGSVWIGAFNEKSIKQELSIPETIVVEGILCLGYSNEVPQNKRMQELRKVVFFNEWDKRSRNISVVSKDYSQFQERFSQSAKTSYQKGITKIKEKLRLNKD